MPITPAMLREHLDLLAEATAEDLDELLHDLLTIVYPGMGPAVCQNN
jgi:hypothetical protein